MERLTKKQLRTIGRIWAGSQLVLLDGGGMDERSGISNYDNASLAVEEAQRQGRIILGKHPVFTDLPDIVKYVRTL